MLDRLNSLILFSIVYFTYHLSAPPSLTGGDSGELLAVGCQLGSAHPPGYPLYTLLTYLWKFIPFPRLVMGGFNFLNVKTEPSIAWKINNLSCILSAFAALFIKWACNEIPQANNTNSNNRVFSFGPTCVALLYAFSPLIWEYSYGAEVFALNNFLCALLLFSTAKVFNLSSQQYDKDEDEDDVTSGGKKVGVEKQVSNDLYFYIYLGALSSGLALSNQHSSFFLVIILVLSVLIKTAKSHMSLWFLYSLSMVFLAGLSPYLYLVYSSYHPQPGSWGDMTSLSGLLVHVMRSEYGTFKLGVLQGEETVLDRVTMYFTHSSRETMHILWPLVLIGIFYYPFNFSSPPKISKKVKIPADPSIKAGSAGKSSPSKNKNKDKNKKEVESEPKTEKIDKSVGKNSTEINSKSKAEASDQTSSTSQMKTDDLQSSPFLVVIIISLVFYLLIWNGILSNLPIQASTMAYAVHARFWMQPLLLSICIASVGITSIEDMVCKLLGMQRTKIGEKPFRINTFYSVELLFMLLITSLLLKYQWPHMNKSTIGDVMHTYAKDLLSDLPPNSLLLAHSDLDLNPVRYLRECENFRRDVTHLSFQFMPFPWFSKMQKNLYPNVSFVPPFQGISTDRTSAGNARLVETFLSMNLDNFPAVYIDMQSIDDSELGAAGEWRGFTLIPHGALYKVERKLPLSEIMNFHKKSTDRLETLITSFPNFDLNYHSVFPPGSWEHAVLSVVNDARYQLGMFLLTFCVELQKDAQIEDVVIILDRLYHAAMILSHATDSALLPLHLNQYKISVTTHENSNFFEKRGDSKFINRMTRFAAFSGVMKDLLKNEAVAWARLNAFISVIPQISPDMIKIIEEKNTKEKCIYPEILDYIARNAEGHIKNLSKTATQNFISLYPDDEDADKFKELLEQLNMTPEERKMHQQQQQQQQQQEINSQDN